MSDTEPRERRVKTPCACRGKGAALVPCLLHLAHMPEPAQILIKGNVLRKTDRKAA